VRSPNEPRPPSGQPCLPVAAAQHSRNSWSARWIALTQRHSKHRLETLNADGQQRIHWSSSDLRPPMLMRAAELFGEGLTVRQVATTLHISKSEAGRLRIRAIQDGLRCRRCGGWSHHCVRRLQTVA
jgi:hypothetical protein